MKSELRQALEEVARRAPLRLDDANETTKDPDNDGRFADDHVMTVPLPAWVLRAIKEAVR